MKKISKVIYILLLLMMFGTSLYGQISKQTYKWIYNNKEYSMDLILNSRTYEYYKNSDKRLLITKDFAIGKFMNIKDNDNLISMIMRKLEALARKHKISEAEMPQFVSAFVQYINYDSAKADKIINEKWDADTELYFHYETVYKNKGVCTDKSILLVSLLRRMNYGAAIILLEGDKHCAVGIESTAKHTVDNSGYEYIETTAPAPIGFVPPQIKMESVEILQKTHGKRFSRL